MGKINNNLVGGFSGQTGNMIGYMWRGKWYVRSKPKQYRDACTEQQVAQRSLFRNMVAFAGKAKYVLRLGLHQASLDNHITECNYFIRINKGCFSMEEGEFVVDYIDLVLSEGPVAPVAFKAVQVIDETTVRIGFDKNPEHRAVKPGDSVYLAGYSPEHDMFMLSAPFSRSSESVEMKFPSEWAGSQLHLWGFVCDGLGNASPDEYIGCGVLAL
ncbi:MAG: hypothetical protein J6T88_09210 [Bacteroidales bacterium]|nr:hypothetical protein [Bacteroidales bacterium]